jgi:hypothetical protein
MMAIQIALSALVTIFYGALLKAFIKEKWIQAKFVAICTGIYLFLLIVIILWLGVFEIRIIRTGLVFATSFSFLIWLIPVFWPELAQELHIKQDDRPYLITAKNPNFRLKITKALVFFFYVTFSYWLIILSINPTRFRDNFRHELWIVPVVFFLAVIQYFRTK